MFPKVFDAKPVRLQTAPTAVRGEVGKSHQHRGQTVREQDWEDCASGERCRIFIDLMDGQ